MYHLIICKSIQLPQDASIAITQATQAEKPFELIPIDDDMARVIRDNEQE
ncbi:hypothetical protein [Marinifilum fragile]|nr:hypothetical protein [Marinifilum fragile]